MEILLIALFVFIGLAHMGFLLLEMVFWTKPLGRKVFRMSLEKAEATKVMAINQGAYNGFLAAGLFWTAYKAALGDWDWAGPLAIFFLSCVFIAGIVGAVSVNKRIFFVQGLPAFLALVLLLGQLIFVRA
jgi:putative membrane protein